MGGGGCFVAHIVTIMVAAAAWPVACSSNSLRFMRRSLRATDTSSLRRLLLLFPSGTIITLFLDCINDGAVKRSLLLNAEEGIMVLDWHIAVLVI